MENAAEALKMAGAVLLFVLALSIIILSFGQARQSADTIIDYKDRETFYIDSDYYYQGSGTEREVGLETIIPSIFRAYLENYKIVFENLPNPIYKIKVSYQNEDGTTSSDELEKTTLDLETKKNTQYENVSLANNDQKREFLCGILYHDFSMSNNEQSEFEKKFNVSLDGCTSLYDQLTASSIESITEQLGVYYQDDSEGVPDVNKTEKRIITYTLKSH